MACGECEGGPDGSAGGGGGRCPACGDTPPEPAGGDTPPAPPAGYGLPAPVPPYGPPPPVPPCGYGPPAPAPWPSAQWQPTRPLAVATMCLLGACIATDVLSIWAGSRLAALIGSGTFLVTDDMEQADLLYGFSGIAQSGAMVASAVLFLTWFHRSRVNAEAFDAGRQRMRRGWAVGAWFVPVVGLWFPKKIANDIWDASLPPGPGGTAGRGGSRGLLNGWWGLWITATVLGTLASNGYRSAETFTAIENAIAFYSVADGVNSLAAVLAILVVRRITAMQHALQEHRTALGTTGPAAPQPYAPWPPAGPVSPRG